MFICSRHVYLGQTCLFVFCSLFLYFFCAGLPGFFRKHPNPAFLHSHFQDPIQSSSQSISLTDFYFPSLERPVFSGASPALGVQISPASGANQCILLFFYTPF